MEQTRYLVLLSKVYQHQDRMDDSVLHLNKAKDTQNRSITPADHYCSMAITHVDVT